VAGDPTGDSISVLLADAHTSSCLWLYQLLTESGFNLIAEAAGAEEVELLLQTHRPLVLLLAGNILPEASVPFLASLRHRYPDTQIVLLLAEIDTLPVQEMVQAGVVGVMVKREPADTIVRAVRAAASGSASFSQEVLTRLIEESLASAPENEVKLTSHELELLHLLATEKSNQQIAQALNVTPKAVEKQLTLLYNKLGVGSRVGAAVWYTLRRMKGEYSTPSGREIPRKL